MRILAVTNLYVTPRVPSLGTYVEQQIKGLKEIGLKVDVLFLDRAQRGIGVYFSLASRVRSSIKEYKPDLVHVMYGGIMADLVTRAARDIPTVVTFHGSDVLGQHLAGPIREAIAEFGVRCSIRAAQRASGIIAVSKSLVDALPQSVNRSRVRVIPCGIDLRRFQPLDQDACRRRLGWAPERFHILFSGSRDPVKRPWLAHAAVEKLRQFGIDGEIHYLRGIRNDEVPIWLNASHVVLLTSSHEGSPTIVKEALACNLPVVSVNVGDVADRIEGIDGCHIALPEASDLATKLHMVRNANRRIAGRAKIDTLSLRSIALEIKTLYGDILQSSNPSTGYSCLPEPRENQGSVSPCDTQRQSY
jgi:teichuronic acid biosynthesis glycosyltransferase TuaC